MAKKSEAFLDFPAISEYSRENLMAELNERIDLAIEDGEDIKHIDILIGKGNFFTGVIKCSKHIPRMVKIIEREEEANPEKIIGTEMIKTKKSDFMCLAEIV